ncbi:DUF4199 domain-containing protein [Zeaxanthinibacter enoshimensis]|uniref:DUF4199 domain-containing protein n=1 Tax=Zeaxanthinibacter enoshimensis TaxID=392009 RepID=UPI0035684BDA
MKIKSIIIRYGIYGLLTGIILFLLVLGLGSGLSFGAQEMVGYSVILISLAFIYPGVKKFRDEKQGGHIGYRKATLVGLLIATFSGIGIAIADFIYLTLINPDFFTEYSSNLRTQGYKGEIPDYGSGFMAAIMFLTVMAAGIIVAVGTAVLLRKKRPR